MEKAKRIDGKIIVDGAFKVTVVYVGAPDRKVFAFDATIHFLHSVHTFLGFGPVDVEVEIEFVKGELVSPRAIRIVIIAKVIVFNFVSPYQKSVKEISMSMEVDAEKLSTVNELSVDAPVAAGQKLFIP